MKTKVFLMLALSVASLASLNQVWADDLNSGSGQTLGSGLNPSSANAGTDLNPSSANADTQGMSSSNTIDNNNSNITPDNATGDDDY